MKVQLSLLAILAAINTVSAGVIVSKRQYSFTDIQILNYALTLEHLEDTFYREGLQNYTQADFINAGFPDPFYDNLVEIAADEKTHVSFLTKALGTHAVAECTYKFPSTTPAQFVALASILEGVGGYLTDAGSILTIEARHSSYIRASLHESPFPSPFDTPLSLDEVYTLAAPLIVSCPPSNPPLPVKAFPTLQLGPSPSNSTTIQSGDTISLLTPGYALLPQGSKFFIYAAFLTITGAVFAPTLPAPGGGGFTVTVPEGVNGQTYVVLTGCNQSVNDETIAAGPAIVEVTNL